MTCGMKTAVPFAVEFGARHSSRLCTSFGPKDRQLSPAPRLSMGPCCTLRLSPRKAQTHRGRVRQGLERGLQGGGPGEVSAEAVPVAARQRGPREGRALGTERWAAAAGVGCSSFPKREWQGAKIPGHRCPFGRRPLPPPRSLPGFRGAPRVCRARGPSGRGAARTPGSGPLQCWERGSWGLRGQEDSGGQARWHGAGEGASL